MSSLSLMGGGTGAGEGLAPSGPVIYVNKEGTGDYSTIQAALDAAVAGTQIKVQGGTYAEDIDFTGVPDGVRVNGDQNAQNVVIAGSSATSTRVTITGSHTLREITVQTPSSGTNPAIDLTGLGAGKLAVLYTVVLQGLGGTGPAVAQGSDGQVVYISCYVNGGTFGGDVFDIDGGKATVLQGATNAGTVTGSVWRVHTGGVLDFSSHVLLGSALLTVSQAAVRVGADATLNGTFQLAQPSGCERGLWVDGDGCDINIIGVDLRSATNDLYISSGLTGAGTAFNLQSAVYVQSSIINLGGATWAQNAEILVTYIDPGTQDDPAARIGGKLDIGAPINPAEISAGEGNSSVQGMVVYTDDGTGTDFADITTALQSSTGSTAALLPGTASGDVVYIGHLGRRFSLLKPNVTTAMVIGSGSGVWEYSDGASGWVAFNVMERDDAGTGTSYAGDVFARVSATTPTKINLGNLASTSAWDTQAVNGTTAYWIRYRLTGAITTAPVLQRLKLGVNSTEIDGGGITASGTARPYRTIPGISLKATDDLAGASPANENIDYGTNIEYTPADNEFVSSATDGFALTWEVPRGLDTSSPVVLTYRIAATTGASSAVCQIDTYVGRITDGTVLDGTNAEDSYSTNITMPGTADETVSGTVDIDLSDFVPGDQVVMAMKRVGGSDAFTGNIYWSGLFGTGRFWGA